MFFSKVAILEFQSTRPVWGATIIIFKCLDRWFNFNPRAPCGARRLSAVSARIGKLHFNPRAPCGARRLLCSLIIRYEVISIHAPRVGRDNTMV